MILSHWGGGGYLYPPRLCYSWNSRWLWHMGRAGRMQEKTIMNPLGSRIGHSNSFPQDTSIPYKFCTSVLKDKGCITVFCCCCFCCFLTQTLWIINRTKGRGEEEADPKQTGQMQMKLRCHTLFLPFKLYYGLGYLRQCPSAKTISKFPWDFTKTAFP